jgi:lysine decarboxylase
MGCGADRDLLETFGRNVFLLDNTSLPQTVICSIRTSGQAGTELAAELYGAQATFFSVNGTSGAVMAMILSVLKGAKKSSFPATSISRLRPALFGGAHLFICSR